MHHKVVLASCKHQQASALLMLAAAMREARCAEFGSQQLELHAGRRPTARGARHSSSSQHFVMQWMCTAVSTSTHSESCAGLLVLNCCPCSCPTATFQLQLPTPQLTTALTRRPIISTATALPAMFCQILPSQNLLADNLPIAKRGTGECNQHPMHSAHRRTHARRTQTHQCTANTDKLGRAITHTDWHAMHSQHTYMVPASELYSTT
jgi:hypothetical protein